MLPAHELKRLIERRFEERASIESTISANFHKCLFKGFDHRFGVKIIIKAIATGTDERFERKRIRRLTNALDRAANMFPHVQSLATLMDYEVHPSHTFLVFKAYGKTLTEVMTMQQLLPLPSSQIKGIAFQILSALRFLHGEDIAHTDIKPDNIVLVDDAVASYEDFQNGEFVTKYLLKNISVKLVDYDDFTDLHAIPRPRHLVGTSIYRPPEVILNMPWSTPVDIFAFGCTIAELYLGRPLFPHSTGPSHQLAIIEERLGRFPHSFIDRVNRGGFNVFRPNGEVDCAEPVAQHLAVEERKHISLCILRPNLLDLLKLCLHHDDKKRCSAKAALQHRFFKRR
ncbi:CMGC/CLK protein kinase [Coprinopsis cinerea okayama7|uniref:CMGC/CLK protein kinase n=1 Tax=Coprinopsis cinerea (strain Okayama-7 / 130 / ATCC MYA-4618 / FGSC 9003) TaxID=240176 RepID=D6RQV9_COPC7|nr:CMGC/CLK protein kinase [Coprinopsis cinerea okayama7\|eukprot:XP_002910198.1 CMGC/CLK protein kinase [Coprinopsis cinerea okayama7\